MVGNELSRLFVVIGAKTEGFNKGMDSASNKMQNVSKKMKIAGGIMIAAVAAVGIASLKMAADFDESFRKVDVMLQATEAEVADYKSRILEVSSATAQSVNKVTDAYYKIVSAGYRGADSIDILRIAMEGATGGAADTLLTTEALTKAMNIFELEGVGGATRAMDSFFGIVDAGLLSFEELASSFPRAASNAAGLGISIEETGALLATLTKVLGTTEQAATATDAIFRLLISPSEAMKALFDEWGVKSGPEAIALFGGLTGVLEKLKEATQGEVTAVRALFSSDEAMKGILPILTSQYEAYNAAVVTVTNSQGRANEAFEKMAEGVTFKWNKAVITIKNGLIKIGTALLPAMTKILNFITPILEKLEDWIGKHTNLVIAIMATVAAVGALLLVGGILLPLLSTAIKSLHLAAAAQWAWNAAMHANPIGLLVAALGLLVFAVISISKQWETTTADVKAQLEEQTRLVRENADKQIQAIWDVYNIRIGNIDAETNAKLDALRAEKNAILKGERDKQLAEQETAALEEVLEGDQEPLLDWYAAAAIARIDDEMAAEIAAGEEKKKTVEEWRDEEVLARKDILGEQIKLNDLMREYADIIAAIPTMRPAITFEPPRAYSGAYSGGPTLPVEPHALGGLITKPTLALLGESGPELVVPLSGEGQTGLTINVSGMVVREEADIKRIARELYDLQRVNARAAGVA